MVLLPLEIVHRILEYDGRIKPRNGKYMNQIAQDDIRYEMLKQIPQIEPYKHLFINFTKKIKKSKRSKSKPASSTFKKSSLWKEHFVEAIEIQTSQFDFVNPLFI